MELNKSIIALGVNISVGSSLYHGSRDGGVLRSGTVLLRGGRGFSGAFGAAQLRFCNGNPLLSRSPIRLFKRALKPRCLLRVLFKRAPEAKIPFEGPFQKGL